MTTRTNLSTISSSYLPAECGSGGALTLTGSNAVISPTEFAAACREIVQQHDGHAAHRMLDRLVTSLLTSLGYGDGMAIFIAAVGEFHPTPEPTDER